ncbi:MAG: NADH:flavin oxidoreductase [Alphaproteobacteria bacterium]|nr:NADH:flavin oxidoreductase [Alphaproteobacteria bacterium]
MAEYDALLKPLKLKHLTIRNRIMSTAHAPAYGDDAMPGERYQLYHEEKAKGGIGLTMFGGSSVVSPDCPAVFGQLDVSGDRVVPYLKQMSERVHRHGAALMCQITHMGRRARWDVGPFLIPVAPSPVREPEHRTFPRTIEDWDIRRIIGDFAQAARRCREGGLDGIELSYSAAHLIAQFWSQGINKRTDEYGGSLDNRMRFSFDVLKAVRAEVGDDFIVGVRFSADELKQDGISAEEGLEIAKRLAKSGLVDFMNVMHSQATDYLSLATLQPNMAFPMAPFLYLASAIKAEVDLPVMHAGRIVDLATASRAVSDGHVDMVAMTRAHLADPHIARKLTEGKPDEIRQCVGASYCVDRLLMGGEALCIQNPATGREKIMPHNVPRGVGGKRVVVVGGGPGGLEAARVSAERGHKVVLFEAAKQVGGQLNVAAKAPWREQLTGITRWLEQQVGKLGVEVRLGTAATADAVVGEKPDIVVVATGGRPNKGEIGGGEHVISTWDILEGRIAPGANVLLFDDHGGHQGPSVAEMMAGRGSQVELVTPERQILQEIGGTNFPIHLRELYKKGVVLTPDTRLLSVYREGNGFVAVLRNEYTHAEEERVVDQVVAEHGTLPNEDLYFALKPRSTNLGEVDLGALTGNRPQALVNNWDGAFQLFRVGDAVASRNVHAAIYDSLRLCKEF